jgi:hypothetical protein
MSDRKPCGKHTQLAANDAVRISQCACGMVHVTLMSNGVTVRVTEEGLRGLTHGLMSALDKVEDGAVARIN